MSDVAQIAKGLTKAQRTAVVSGRGTSRTISKVAQHEPRLFGSYSWSAGYGELRRPTEIGLAVRAHLLSENPS